MDNAAERPRLDPPLAAPVPIQAVALPSPAPKPAVAVTLTLEGDDATPPLPRPTAAVPPRPGTAPVAPAWSERRRSTSDEVIEAAFRVAAERSLRYTAARQRGASSGDRPPLAAGQSPEEVAGAQRPPVAQSASVSGITSPLMRPECESNANLDNDRLVVAAALSNARGPDLLDPNCGAARTRLQLLKAASRLGRGLQDDPNARLLMAEHWLEATDTKHRYGSLLKHYHEAWRQSQTRQKFFYWLDYGEGKDIDLTHAPRYKLERSLVKYCNHTERTAYVVIVQDHLLVYRATRKPLHTGNPGELVTSDARTEDKYIFVFDTIGTLYVGRKVKGAFHHSSFLAGGTVRAAGNLVVNEGKLLRISPHSGHYMPTPEDMNWVLNLFSRRGVDLTDVIVDPLKKNLIT